MWVWEEIKNESGIVGNVVYRGLLAGVEFVQDKETKQPFPASAKMANRVFAKALENGLITRPIAIDNTDIIAICPPLIINEQQIDRLLSILGESIKQVEEEL
jgi:putrescine---pyruvate transaminase